MLLKRVGKFARRPRLVRKPIMDRNIRNVFTAIAVVSTFLITSVGIANAQRRNDRDIRDALRSLNSKIEDFENDLRYQMQQSSSGNGQASGVADDIRSLRDATLDFEENLDRHRENRDDVNKIIEAAGPINAFLQVNQQNRRVEDDWAGVRRQIDRLGANYGVTTNWNTVEEEPPPYVADDRWPVQKGNNTQSVGLSGTYELDRARSENIDDIVTNANLGNEQREDLKDKLEAPQQISIDIRGNQVTLSTSTASPVTFTADGRDKTEKSPSGQTIRLRATLTGQNLVVSSLGGETDYTITFTTVSNGRGMKVQRRITTDYLNQTVIAESVYNKTDTVAQLGTGSNNVPSNPNSGGTVASDPNGGYSDNDNSGNVSNGGSPNNPGTRNYPGSPRAVTAPPGNYVVPNGVILSGVLENEINTKVSQNNDRFRLTVQSPTEFRGAVIEGYISGVGRSGKVTGQSNVTFNFERITLRNGQSYDFAGYLQGIRDQNGKSVNIDNEGTARGDSQTRETATRGGIGAGIGAVIGAIAGGGKGAAIGAVVGGGAGAGSAVIQGRDDIRLMQGSTITVQSSSPNQNYPR